MKQNEELLILKNKNKQQLLKGMTSTYLIDKTKEMQRSKKQLLMANSLKEKYEKLIGKLLTDKRTKHSTTQLLNTHALS